MKTLISVSTLALLLCGCATINWIDELAQDANLAAYVGASIDIADNPDRKVMYQASMEALNTLIRDENYQPSAFIGALKDLPIKELKSNKATLVVGAAVMLWTRAAARVDINQVELTKRVMPAVRDGLKQAIDEAK